MRNRKKNRILLINDMAGYGKVALSVMIPVLSQLKFEVFNLPTALVSNTLDYGVFDILDTTKYMRNTIDVWSELGFSFDAVCTGFMVSEKQSELVYEYCKQQSERGTLIFVDPIMGDDGKKYNGVTNEAVKYMKRLCSIADVIVPNITEACLLTGYEMKKSYTLNEAELIANLLNALGAKAVVITSLNIGGKMYTFVKTSSDSDSVLLPYDEIPVRFPGTGDIFTSLTVGHYLRNKKLTKSVKKSMEQLEEIIRCNADNKDKYKGIPIEQYSEVIRDEKAEN